MKSFKILIQHCDSVSKNKIGRDETLFLNTELIIVKCSASQKLVKYFLFD